MRDIAREPIEAVINPGAIDAHVSLSPLVLSPPKVLRYRHVVTPPEETEHGTRPGGRGPGGVPGGVGSKNRGGGMCAYT